MTPKENYQAVLKRKKPERLPIYAANMSDFLQQYYGISARDFVDDPDEHVAVTIKGVEDFGFACVAPVAYILFGAGPEMGVRWRFSGDSLPGPVEGLIKTEADLPKASVPRRPGGYFKNYLEILRKLRELLGDRVYIMGFALGPHSTSVFFRGMEQSLIDPLANPALFQKYMAKCVDLSIFFGTHVLKVGLPNAVLLEVFVSPDLIGPEYYHQHVAPYDEQVVQYFKDRGLSLPNSFGAFMGRAGDKESQKMGRYLYDHFYGSKESLNVVRQAMAHDLQGFPAILTLSGRMMVEWPSNDITEFLKEGLELMVRENHQYPAVRLTSLQPPDRREAFDMADKIRAVREVVDSFPL